MTYSNGGEAGFPQMLRVGEAAKLGFTRCVVPKGNKLSKKVAGLEIIAVSSIREAMEVLF